MRLVKKPRPVRPRAPQAAHRCGAANCCASGAAPRPGGSHRGGVGCGLQSRCQIRCQADVLTTEMKRLASTHARAAGRSTVAEYLSILGPTVTEFPNNLPKYLQTPCPSAPRGSLRSPTQLPSALKPAPHAPSSMTARMRQPSSSPCLECPAFHKLRQQLLTATRTMVGEPKFRAWSQLPLKTQLRAVLGDQWWGPHAKTGDECGPNVSLTLGAATRGTDRRRWQPLDCWCTVSHTIRQRCWRESPWLRLRLVHNDNNNNNNNSRALGCELPWLSESDC